MRNQFSQLLAIVASVLLSVSAIAADQSWNGDSGVNSDWSNGDNWVGDPLAVNVPGEFATDTATFPAGGPWAATFDAMASGNLDALVVESDTTLTLAEDVTFASISIANGATLNIAGSGTIRTSILDGPGGLNIASAQVVFEMDGSSDVTALASFANAGRFEVVGGVSLTTATPINLGWVRFSANHAISGEFTSGTLLEVMNGASVQANRVQTFNLSIEAGGSLTAALGGEVTMTASISGSFVSSGDFEFSGGTLTFDATANVLLSGTSSLTQSGSANVTIDRSAVVTIGGDFKLSGETTFQNSDNSNIASGISTLTVSGDMVVSADVLDSNMIPMLDGAVEIVLAGNIELDDSAGYDFDLDESKLNASAAGSHTLGTTPTQSNFDGEVSIGHLEVNASVGMSDLPSDTRINLLSLTMTGSASIALGAADVRLSGTFQNTGSGNLNAVGGSIRPENDLHALTLLSIDGFDMMVGETLSLDGQILINGSLSYTAACTLNIGTRFDSDIDLLAPGNLSGDMNGALQVGALAASSVDFSLEGDLTLTQNDVSIGAAGCTVNMSVDGTTTLGTGVLPNVGVIQVFADGVSGNGSTNIEFRGDVLLPTDGSVIRLGEGEHRFGGDLDISSSQNSFIRNPALGAGSDSAEVHLIGFANQIISLEALLGNAFWVNEVSALTSVTQNGILRLDGELDLSASTQASVWSVNAGAELHADASGNNTIRHGSANASFGPATVFEHNDLLGADTSLFNVLTIEASAGASGMVIFDSLMVEGDTQDTDAAANGDESNAGRVVVSNGNLRVDGDLTIANGAALMGGFGNGASFVANGGSLTLAGGNLLIGNGAAPDNAAAASWQSLDARVNVGDTRSIECAGLTSSALIRTTITSAPFEAFTLTVDPAATAFSLSESEINGGSQGMATISLGAAGAGAALAGLRLIDSTFSNMSSGGVQIAGGTEFSAFSGNAFQNGVMGGALLSFLGNATGQLGSNQLADFNTFDASTIGGDFTNIVSDAGNLVRVASDADNVRINFRAPANAPTFGTDSNNVSLTAQMAEDDDNDGEDVVAPDNDVTWGIRDLIDVDLVGFATRSIAVDGMKRSALLFSAEGFGMDPAIQEVTFTLDGTNLLGPGITAGPADALVLFRDDGDTAGVFDAMDTILAMDDGSTLGGGTVVFDLSAMPVILSAGSPETWGLALSIDANSSGSIAVSIAAGGVVGASLDTIVDGLPLSSTVLATNGDLTVTANFNNGNAGTSVEYLAQRDNPLVMAFDVANSADALSATIHEIEIEVDSLGAGLPASQLAAVVERLVLFSSVNSGYGSSYINDAGMNYGAADDDALFDVVEGGAANLTFTNGVASVSFNSVTGVTIAPGASASFFLILDPSGLGADINPAVAANLAFRFGLSDPTADGTVGGIRTAGLASDVISVGPNQAPFVGELLSRNWLITNTVGLGGGGGGGGCAISNSPSKGWGFMLFALLLLVAGRARKRSQASA